MAQPTNPLIVWASDDVILPNAQRPNKSLPSESLIQTGWDLSQKPAADEWNYLLNNNGQYIKWLIEEKINEFLKKSENLNDLANKATARNNLNVYSKAESDANFLDAASNLSDLNNTTTALTNLNVFSKSEVNSKTISAGNGLTGGGDLSANRTISMGTPSTVGPTTSNTASGTTHTHALDATGNVAVLTGTIAHGGTIPLPAGYTQAQCRWMVSMSEDNPTSIPWDITESGDRLHYHYKCTADSNRVVTALTYLDYRSSAPGVPVNGNANYIIIGVK